MILIRLRQFVEIATPAPNADDKIGIFFGMLLRLKQHLSTDGVKLKLVTAKGNVALDQHSNLLLAFFVAEYRIVKLKGQRSSVDKLCQIVFCK